MGAGQSNRDGLQRDLRSCGSARIKALQNAGRNTTDGQRDVIGKMLAEEKVKLLKLHSPQEQ